MCIASRAPSPAPQPVIQPAKDEPAPILKLRTDDGSEEVVSPDAVKKDTGSASISGLSDKGSSSLSIPTGNKKKNNSVAA